MGMPEGAVVQKMAVEGVSQKIQDAVLAGGEDAAPEATSHGGLSAEEEEIADRFRKMLKMGMPEGAVVQKMAVEGVSQKIQDAVLAEVEHVAPETSSPGADAYSPEGLTAEEEEIANRFRKMLKMGMPAGAVQQKMAVEGISQKIQDAVLAGEDNAKEEEKYEPPLSSSEGGTKSNSVAPPMTAEDNSMEPNATLDLSDPSGQYGQEHKQEEVDEEMKSATTSSNEVAAAAPKQNQQQDVEIGESWIVDKSQFVDEDDYEEVYEDEASPIADESESESESSERTVSENEVGSDRNQQGYVRDERQAEAIVASTSRSRSAAVAPAPQNDVGSSYDIEEQRKVIKSSEKGKRSQMSAIVPILSFLIIAAAILLVVFLVVLKKDEVSVFAPSMGPTPMDFLPLEPTSNGNIEAAATTRFDSFRNSCNFQGLTYPNVIDQCACTGLVTVIADDVRDRHEYLVDNFIPSVYPQWNASISSCTAENQALLWMSSGINNGGEISNLLRLQRFALALLYIQQGGPGWRRSTGWLSEKNVCEWEGVDCDDQFYVQFLNLNLNRLTGELSEAPALLNAIKGYYARENDISGEIPGLFFENKSLLYLDLSSNDLTGEIPIISEENQLRGLNLASNNLIGNIPSEIARAGRLETLNLAINRFSGTLPNELFTLPLTELAVAGNILNGTIPSEIGDLSDLASLSLGPNLFTGEIPTVLSELTSLTSLSIFGIPGLGGRLPASYGLFLTKMKEFVLAETSVRGNIPEQFGGMTDLEILRLNGNSLERTIPAALGQLSKLVTLHLNDNDFTGTVPETLGSLTLLEELQFHTNRLVGTIPETFSNLLQLRKYIQTCRNVCICQLLVTG